MSNDDDKFGFSDKTAVDLDGTPFRDAAGKPKPKSAEELAGGAPGTVRQAAPTWNDDDDDDGEKTAALDLAALGVLNPDGSLKPLDAIGPGGPPDVEAEPDPTMALEAQAIRDQLRPPSPPVDDDGDERTVMATSPFVDDEPEEKTVMAASPFA